MCAIQGELGMSFSSWDDGSWRRILKEEYDDEAEKDKENTVWNDPLLDEEVERAESEMSDEQINARRAAEVRDKSKLSGTEAQLTGTTTSLGDRASRARRTETGKEEDKLTDEDYLRIYEEKYNTEEAESPEFRAAQAAREQEGKRKIGVGRGKFSGPGKYTWGKQGLKDAWKDVKTKVTGYDPNKRRSEQAGYGKVGLEDRMRREVKDSEGNTIEEDVVDDEGNVVGTQPRTQLSGPETFTGTALQAGAKGAKAGAKAIGDTYRAGKEIYDEESDVASLDPIGAGKVARAGGKVAGKVAGKLAGKTGRKIKDLATNEEARTQFAEQAQSAVDAGKEKWQDIVSVKDRIQYGEGEEGAKRKVREQKWKEQAKERTDAENRRYSEEKRRQAQSRIDAKDEDKVRPAVSEAQTQATQAGAMGTSAPDVSAGFPNEVNVLQAKTGEMLVEAEQEILEGKAPSRKEDTQRWMDMLISVSPNDAKAQEKVKRWKEILDMAAKI